MNESLIFDEFFNQTFMPKVKVVRVNKTLDLPTYQTRQSAGMDLFASEDVIVPANGRALVKSGIKIALPIGWEAQIRPRSGLALKQGITVLNTPGTIDADYRGEIGVILFNTTSEDFHVKVGYRIAQMVFARAEQLKFQEVDELDETDRGEGGFGHTGK